MMNTKKIPIVFAFDDNYALPASIAIKSLLDTKKEGTEYEIIVFHGGLKTKTIKKFSTIANIRWIKVEEKQFKDVPIGWSGLATYYRLLIADLLPEYDKVIWSDVDVLFRGDLSEIFNQDMEDADWGGIIAERQDEQNGIHTHFDENTKPYIYMPGFMLVNTKLWREKKLALRFWDIIREYQDRLKMFDLDILNLAADKIMPVPFSYCVLENIYDADDISTAREYPWLSRAQGEKELLDAKANPVIIHYAGERAKIWNRDINEIPCYYREYLLSSVFNNRNKSYYRKTKLKILLLGLLILLCPIKRIRKNLRHKKQKLKETIAPKKTSSIYENNFISSTVCIGSPENVELGGKIYIGEDCKLYAEGGLKIGAYTKIGQGCLIMTTAHNYKSQTRIPFDHIGILRRTEIGKNCWLGVRCIICGGVKIEDGAIIGAGAVVTKSVPKCAIVAGNPARIIGWRDKELYNKLEESGMNFPQEKEPPREWIREEGFKEYYE